MFSRAWPLSTRSSNMLERHAACRDRYQKPLNGRTMIFVIESGKDKMATWVSEQRNVAEDFRSAFGSRPPDVEGIAIMTDSDNTKSSATADYDDFRASAAK